MSMLSASKKGTGFLSCAAYVGLLAAGLLLLLAPAFHALHLTLAACSQDGKDCHLCTSRSVAHRPPVLSLGTKDGCSRTAIKTFAWGIHKQTGNHVAHHHHHNSDSCPLCKLLLELYCQMQPELVTAEYLIAHVFSFAVPCQSEPVVNTIGHAYSARAPPFGRF